MLFLFDLPDGADGSIPAGNMPPADCCYDCWPAAAAGLLASEEPPPPRLTLDFRYSSIAGKC